MAGGLQASSRTVSELEQTQILAAQSGLWAGLGLNLCAHGISGLADPASAALAHAQQGLLLFFVQLGLNPTLDVALLSRE